MAENVLIKFFFLYIRQVFLLILLIVYQVFLLIVLVSCMESESGLDQV